MFSLEWWETKQERWHFCVLLYICNLKPKDANFIPRKLLKVEFFFFSLQNFGGEGYWWRLVCPHIYTNNTQYSFCLVTQGVNGTSTIIAYWSIHSIVLKPVFCNWGKVWATKMSHFSALLQIVNNELESILLRLDAFLTVHHELTIKGVPGGMWNTSGECSLS